jgi:hypothetical protein
MVGRQLCLPQRLVVHSCASQMAWTLIKLPATSTSPTVARHACEHNIRWWRNQETRRDALWNTINRQTRSLCFHLTWHTPTVSPSVQTATTLSSPYASWWGIGSEGLRPAHLSFFANLPRYPNNVRPDAKGGIGWRSIRRSTSSLPFGKNSHLIAIRIVAKGEKRQEMRGPKDVRPTEAVERVEWMAQYILDP